MQNSGTKVRSNREGVTKEASGPARLMDNSAQISNVADLKFPMNWPQTNLREVKETSIENRLEMEGLFDVDVSMSVVHDKV